MLVATLGLLFVTDPVLALVGSIVFPTIAGLTVLYSRRMSPLMTLAQQQRGQVSGIAHESFDGALVVKTLGRETDETERFRTASLELRDTMTAGRPGPRAVRPGHGVAAGARRARGPAGRHGAARQR
jgi:ABC-type multidrug transport system fused ATPase/permease subunit